MNHHVVHAIRTVELIRRRAGPQRAAAGGHQSFLRAPLGPLQVARRRAHRATLCAIYHAGGAIRPQSISGLPPPSPAPLHSQPRREASEFQGNLWSWSAMDLEPGGTYIGQRPAPACPTAVTKEGEAHIHTNKRIYRSYVSATDGRRTRHNGSLGLASAAVTRPPGRGWGGTCLFPRAVCCCCVCGVVVRSDVIPPPGGGGGGHYPTPTRRSPGRGTAADRLGRPDTDIFLYTYFTYVYYTYNTCFHNLNLIIFQFCEYIQVAVIVYDGLQGNLFIHNLLTTFKCIS